MKTALRLNTLFGLAILLTSVTLQAQFNCITNNGTIVITGYTGLGGALIIPGEIDGMPVTAVGEQAFAACSNLTSVAIPDSVTYLGSSSFRSCTGLTNVTIGNSVTNIGYAAFEDCSALTGMTIGKSVTHIEAYVFFGCVSLKVITVDPENTTFSSVNGVLFDKGRSLLVQYPGGVAGAYTIPDSVTSIWFEAFWGCTKLASIIIPNTATNIGGWSFYGCTSLTNLTIGNSVTSIGSYAFSGCISLTSVTIPDAVTSIEAFAFYDCPSLTNLTMGNALTSIGGWAFMECSSLNSLTIPNSVTNIGFNAFAGCSGLTNVYFEGNAPVLADDAFTDSQATVCYLPGTTGWGTTFGGRPTVLWVRPDPTILTTAPSFGPQTNGFGFTISWATNASIVVEFATDMTKPMWFPMSTNMLTGGTFYFGDPEGTKYPSRFYRVRAH